MIQQAKLGDGTSISVRETSSSPEPVFILARDHQLDDLVWFCTILTDFSVLATVPEAGFKKAALSMKTVC